MASISCRHVKKVYPGNVTAVPDFNLEIADKEFIVFVGPSGCGKSTTLRMIAGLEEISGGEMYIGDRLINDVPPKDRDIAMVFQNYALYPHMTVYKNMAFGLELRKMPKDEIDKRVREAAKILEIEHLLDRKPKALSGGQRQRVALGRAMVRNPAVFLLDEPLSNLDAKLRTSMRTEIIKLHKKLKKAGDQFVVDLAGTEVPLPKEKTADGKLDAYVGKTLKVGIRPEDIKDDEEFLEKHPNSHLSAEVEVSELMGAEIYLYLTYQGQNLMARVAPTSKSRRGDKITVAMDTHKIHLFDPETEKTLLN